jgi:hypothetical protein
MCLTRLRRHLEITAPIRPHHPAHIPAYVLAPSVSVPLVHFRRSLRARSESGLAGASSVGTVISRWRLTQNSHPQTAQTQPKTIFSFSTRRTQVIPQVVEVDLVW